MKLYLARHGQTEWNRLDKICGRTDLPLNETGIQQAHLLAEKVRDAGIHLIIASPMLRARQTAAVVAETAGVPVLTDERIIEQNYGIYEGVNRLDEGFLNNKRCFAVRFPGGESMMDVAMRSYSFLKELKEKHPGENILVVSHGGVIRVMHTYFCDMTNDEFFHFTLDNADVLSYEW